MAHYSAPSFSIPTTFLDGPDRDDVACRSLWAAVIYKAMKDLAYASQKAEQSRLTPSEREKLQRIFELDTPESFFLSPWFEEICRNLELSASRIRTEILDRYANGTDLHSAISSRA